MPVATRPVMTRRDTGQKKGMNLPAFLSSE